MVSPVLGLADPDIFTGLLGTVYTHVAVNTSRFTGVVWRVVDWHAAIGS